MKIYPTLALDGVVFFFCEDRCRDEWYLRLRDPQSPRYDEKLAMAEFEMGSSTGPTTERCAQCHRVLSEVKEPVL